MKAINDLAVDKSKNEKANQLNNENTKITFNNINRLKSNKMKTKLSLIAVFISALVFGQNYEYNPDSEWGYNNAIYMPVQFNHLSGKPAIDAEQLHFILINSKGKKTEYYKEYNKDGKLLKYYKKDSKKGILPIAEFDYQDNKVKTAKSFKNKKIISSTEKKWYGKDKLLETKRTNRKGELVSLKTWEYNNDSCLISSTYEKRGKLKRKWEYEYYDKSNKSSTKLYNGKGKLLNVWTYDCNQEGEKLTVKNDTTQICKWDESSSDYLIKVYQTFDDKGKIKKYVKKYTKTDTLIVEITTYDENESMLYHSTFNKSFEKPLMSEGYRKGKKTYSFEYQYDDDKVTSFNSYWKDKLCLKYENKYDGERLIEQKRYDKKGELSLTIQLEYEKSFANGSNKVMAE